MNNKESLFKGKTVKEHYEDVAQVKDGYQAWRDEMKEGKTGFFPVFTNQMRPYLKDVSGNAIRLYIYLGIHSNNMTGEVIGTNVRMMEQFFDCSVRAVQNWLTELEKAKLIRRIQTKVKGAHFILLLPYSTQAHMEWNNEVKANEPNESSENV